MKVIWKFPLPDIRSTVPMPVGASVLSVQYQGDQLCLWAMVDPVRSHELRVFEMFGTGHQIPSAGAVYVGTVQDRQFVRHLFEVNP